MTALPWVHDDGGRSTAGFKGLAGDCVTRAIAIAADLPYLTVYDHLHNVARVRLANPRVRRGRNSGASPRTGVMPEVYKPYLAMLGFEWTPTMSIGSGTRVHLAEGELPDGRLIVRLSGHLAAVVDGVIHDTFDPSRGGRRAVYGHWRRE